MTPEIKKLLRPFILAALRAQGAPGMVEPVLLRDARLNVSPQITAPELERELLEQADLKWIIAKRPLIGEPRWRITADGESVAEELGL